MSTGVTYLRHQRVPGGLQKMGPLPADSWLLKGGDCPGCRLPFTEGDRITLVPIGPGEDPDEQAKAAQGRAFNAIAIAVHWTCATGEPA